MLFDYLIKLISVSVAPGANSTMSLLPLTLLALSAHHVLATKVEENQSRFDNYRIYRIHLDALKHIEVFQDIERRSDSYQFYGHPRQVGQKVNVLVAAHKIAEITDIFQTFNVKFELLTYNFQEKIDQQAQYIMPPSTLPEKMDWQHFYHLDTIYAWMEKLASEFEDVSVISMGSSLEGRNIKGLRIGSSPHNTAVFIESGIHAREWIAPATATFIMKELVASENSTVGKYAKEFNWFIFPVLNTDGYAYTFNNDRMWRKNRQLFGTCRGVDLNRNYPYRWNETGSSAEPCGYDYAGPSAGSEPETQCLMKFIKDHAETHRIKTYISLHSYSQLIMFPYGTEEKVSNYDDLRTIGLKATETIKRISGQNYASGSIFNTIYPSSGCSQDWIRKDANIPIVFTFELRGPPSTPDLFILPIEQLQPTAEEIFAAILTILETAKTLGYYES